MIDHCIGFQRVWRRVAKSEADGDRRQAGCAGRAGCAPGLFGACALAPVVVANGEYYGTHWPAAKQRGYVEAMQDMPFVMDATEVPF